MGGNRHEGSRDVAACVHQVQGRRCVPIEASGEVEGLAEELR